MAEKIQETKPVVKVDSYNYIAQRMFDIVDKYGNVSPDVAFTAFSRAGGNANMMSLLFPPIQNHRIKEINTLPKDVSKDKLSEMVSNPDENEKSLRAVSTALASNTKTYDLIMQTYQDIMTYDWYIYPTYVQNAPDFATQLRDYSLCEQIVRAADIKAEAHKAVGLATQYGKVFYTFRLSVDKSHNKVNYAFLQQLPTDFCKIVGFNNGAGKYTVAFNLMYFARQGTDWRQFGDLFKPYMSDFEEVAELRGKYAYMSKDGDRVVINTAKFNSLKENKILAGNPEWLMTGTQCEYWVTLEANDVFVFETNDRSVNVVPSTTGLMVSMTQIPNFESAQMEIILNPLTSVMTGEIPVYDTKVVTQEDPIVVSPSTRKLFESLWYQMLNANNTSGIGLFAAPFKNMKLQTVSDTIAATDIASNSVADQIQKAGLASLIPTTNDPKVGVAEISAKINSQFARPIYWAFERLFNYVFETLNLKQPMRFAMFGNIFDRNDELEEARTGMTLGLGIATFKYNALMGHTFLDDTAITGFINDSGIIDKRKPLESTYGRSLNTSYGTRESGRPEEDGSENSQKTEKRKISSKRKQADGQISLDL